MIIVLTILIVIAFVVGGFFLMDRLDHYLDYDHKKYDKMQDKKDRDQK